MFSRKLLFVFSLFCFSSALFAQPEMDLARGASPVSDGGFDQAGSYTAGVGFNLSYTISNSGTTDLTVSTPVAAPVSPFNCQVTVSTQPAATVAPAGSTTLTFNITPISGGFFSFQPNIVNDDGNENPYNWFVSGTGLGPSMSLFRVAGIANGGTDALPNGAPGVSQTYTYTIYNYGNQPLNLVVPLSSPASLVNCTASISQQPQSPVPTSAGVQFAVTVTSTALGAFSCTVAIGNDDPGKNPFSFTMSGTSSAPAPEMDLRRGATPVADGGTAFISGQWATGVLSTLTFTVTNPGTGALNITTPIAAPGSPTNCSASIQSQPASSLAPGATTTVVVAFTPATAAPFSFTLSMANDDASENPYNFTVSGMASPGVSPDIEVQRNTTPVADGSTDNVGIALTGTGTSFNYVLRNAGTGQLTFADLAAPGSTVNCTAVILTQPVSPLMPNTNSPFIVRVTPTAAGVFSCNVVIDNNDAGENPYDFTISGTASATVPEIDIARGTIPLTDGGFDMVGTQAFGTPLSFTYTLSNSGTGALTLTLPVTAPGTLFNCTAAISQQPASATVPASASTTLVVQISPTAAGAFSCTLAISSDDSDENPFNWTISGFAAVGPEIDVQRPAGTGIADGALHDLGAAPQGSASTYTFSVSNSGSANLTLAGAPLVQISNLLNCTAAVATMPSANVAAAGSTTFVVTVTPTAPGSFGFVILIPNNDADEAVYNFSVVGNTASAGNGGDSGSSESGCSTAEAGAWWLTAALALLAAAFLRRARQRYKT